MTTLGTPLSPHATRVLLLGSGELGKEVALELQRFGVEVIAADRYADAPAMQVAHRSHVLDMLDPVALREASGSALAHFPDVWSVVRLRAETLAQNDSGENVRDDHSGIEQARGLVSNFVSRQWWNHDAALFQGKLEERLGNFSTAAGAYERAGRLDCWETAAWQCSAMLCLRAGQLEQALICQRIAVRHQPSDREAHRVLAFLLDRSESPPAGEK